MESVVRKAGGGNVWSVEAIVPCCEPIKTGKVGKLIGKEEKLTIE